MRSYAVGDMVEILTLDGATFRGRLDFDDQLVYLNGLGFPWDSVAVMMHG